LRHDAKKVGLTGYYTRLEWPMPGGLFAQYKHISDILNIIKDEETERKFARLG